MLPTNYSRYKYTPDEIDEQEFLDKFVIRNDDFAEIFDDIKHADYSVANQHFIIIGQRGQGKTTLLRKITLEVQADEDLASFLLPIKFAEEQYQIRSLSRLWEEVADYLQSVHEDEFPDILDNMEEHFEDDDYEEQSFSYLDKAVKAKGKKLLLLIDNIDELLGKLNDKEQRRLREILISSSTFRIVGGSTKMLEQQFDYGKPFYEFFKIIKLSGLNREECFKFISSIGNEEQKKQIDSIIQNTPERIETLRRLTGGVPRTLVMLFEIFLDDGGNTFDDLLKILDDATPLYKHRMDDLPNTLQDITHTIAMNWDGITTKEIAKKTRLESKVVSAQLKQLEKKYGIIESISIGKNKIYKIEERFFNIWYLMRFGRKKDRQKVEWLVNFLVSWCDKNELENRAGRLIDSVKRGGIKDSYAFHMCEALSYAGLNLGLEHEMKESVKSYLLDANSKYASDVSLSDVELGNQATQLSVNNKTNEAIKLLLGSQKNSGAILWLVGRLYEKQKKTVEAEEFYLKSIAKGTSEALSSLGGLYHQTMQFDNAIKYYLKAIKQGDTESQLNLGNLYREQGKLIIAEEYYLKAVEKGDYLGLNNLGALYQYQGKLVEAEEYYLKAIEKGITMTSPNLSWLYFKQGQNMAKALKLIYSAYEKKSDSKNTYILSIILLWMEDISASYNKFLQYLDHEDNIFDEGDISIYLNLLIAKKQLHKAKELMEISEYKFKDKFKPIWYALMTLMENEYPHEIKKMGSELQESVDEVLLEAGFMEIKYSLK